MTLKLPFSLIVFISSYFPLMLILAIKDYDFAKCGFKNPTLVVLIFGLTAISCITTLIAARSVKDGNLVNLTKVSNKSTDMFTYTIPYMLSFYKFDLTDLNMVLSLGVFMGLMFILSYRTQSVFVNPVLAIAGYGLYDCQFKDGTQDRQGLVLSKTELEVGGTCRVQQLSTFLYFATTKI